MFCSKCGKEIRGGSRVCPKCGNTISSSESSVRAVQFVCKGCNSVMTISTDSPILKCPCCGSSELIIENDNVTIERIRSKTVLEQQQIDKEIELEKLYYDEKREERRNKKQWREVKIVWTIVAVLFLVFFSAFFLPNKINSMMGKIEFPFSHWECEEMQYDALQIYLADAGFTNVKVRELNDLHGDEDIASGQVYMVMINGQTDFYSDTMIKPDDNIIIYYHTLKNEP